MRKRGVGSFILSQAEDIGDMGLEGDENDEGESEDRYDMSFIDDRSESDISRHSSPLKAPSLRVGVDDRQGIFLKNDVCFRGRGMRLVHRPNFERSRLPSPWAKKRSTKIGSEGPCLNRVKMFRYVRKTLVVFYTHMCVEGGRANSPGRNCEENNKENPSPAPL